VLYIKKSILSCAETPSLSWKLFSTLTTPVWLLFHTAFPAQRRIIKNGIIRAPEIEIDAVRRFSKSKYSQSLITLDIVRSKNAQMENILQSAGQSKKEIIIIDAENDDDLAAIALASSHLAGHIVLCGSAGLAAHLSVEKNSAKQYILPRAKKTVQPFCLLAVAGTTRPETARQIQKACEQFVVPAVCLNLHTVSTAEKAGKRKTVQTNLQSWLRQTAGY
jgi:uncharacterized protein YgbK (DUF1537 family)